MQKNTILFATMGSLLGIFINSFSGKDCSDCSIKKSCEEQKKDSSVIVDIEDLLKIIKNKNIKK